MAIETQSRPRTAQTERNGNQNNEAARQLLRKWRDVETRNDEAAWLDVQQLIEDNRLSVRRKFGE